MMVCCCFIICRQYRWWTTNYRKGWKVIRN